MAFIQLQLLFRNKSISKLSELNLFLLGVTTFPASLNNLLEVDELGRIDGYFLVICAKIGYYRVFSIQ